MKPYRQPAGMTGGAAKQRLALTTALRFVAAYRALGASASPWSRGTWPYTTPTPRAQARAARAEFDAARAEFFAACDALTPPAKAAR